MVNRKYSKSSSFYLKTKKNFFESNDEMFNKVLGQNDIYISQIKRTKCKICLTKLDQKVDLKNHNVEYIFCSKCSHLNGIYEDTEMFIEKMYVEDDGGDYSKNYIDDNFKKRASDIYLPKVDFLLKNISYKNPKILDVGCGGGHFVFAGLMKGCDIKGIDVSKKLIQFGNNQIFNHTKEKARLSFKSENEMYVEVENSDSDVLSAMGVIEHLREPHKLFKAFKKSRIKHFYYSVPMFSLTALLENVFEKVFPRHLSAGHTHLYTENSIKEMNKIIGIDSKAEWRFGTDAMDLYRNLNVTLEKNSVSDKTMDFFSNGYLEIIDKFQKILDENHFCSEIHLVGIKKSEK